MPRYLDGSSVAAFAGNRGFSWRTFFNKLTDTARIWRQRQRDRRELLDYLARDHRAANDLCIDRSDARKWAERPFWRA
jgi:uncharacterized protein YjiS (DUF1127 family)